MIRRAALLVALALSSVSPVFLLDESPREPVCHEDMACWDWRTMGNRCGRDSLSEPVRCYSGGKGEG